MLILVSHVAYSHEIPASPAPYWQTGFAPSRIHVCEKSSKKKSAQQFGHRDQLVFPAFPPAISNHVRPPMGVVKYIDCADKAQASPDNAVGFSARSKYGRASEQWWPKPYDFDFLKPRIRRCNSTESRSSNPSSSSKPRRANSSTSYLRMEANQQRNLRSNCAGACSNEPCATMTLPKTTNTAAMKTRESFMVVTYRM